ncbi:MAG: hypothetical protein SVY10_16315 [Thermodesulfobacteriota bacterium]|nr:hypothetical protein [Thermodesulfobacteriota bacterium]
MRHTTLDLEDDILLQIRKISLEEGMTCRRGNDLKEVINASLRKPFENPGRKKDVELHWKTYTCGKPKPKVILSSREALFSKMEE